MKKKLITLLFAGACLLLASCGGKDISGRDSSDRNSSQNSSADESSTDRNSSQNSSADESSADMSSSDTSSAEKNFDQLVDELCQGEYVQDSTGTAVPNTDYLPLPEFNALPENAVFDVLWDTTEGSYAAGTAFLMETDLSDDPLLITALHFFGEEEYVSGPELPDYVNGGEVYDILKDGSVADGTISTVLLIPDAVAFGDAETASKDLAAFTLSDTSGMNAFPIATEPCQPGDMIYLAAYLSSEYVYDDNLYPCVVLSDNGTDLYYVLNDIFTTSGASGCPLLNSRGEVVGIHIASGGSTRYGHSAQSIYEQLKGAFSAQ